MKVSFTQLMTGCFVLFLLSSNSLAAELRGKVYSSDSKPLPGGAEVRVSCGEESYRTEIAPKGAFSIRSIPSKTACYYQLWYSDTLQSELIPLNFLSASSIVQINAKVIVHGERLILLKR
jgi:hypothetical protein